MINDNTQRPVLTSGKEAREWLPSLRARISRLKFIFAPLMGQMLNTLMGR